MPFYTSDLIGGVPEGVLAAHRAAVAKAGTGTGFTPSMGLEAFSLEAPSKIYQPFAAELVKRLARVPNPMSNSSVTRWKVINQSRPDGLVTVSQETGVRGPKIVKTTSDNSVALKTIRVQDEVIDDARIFAQDYEDLMATASFLALENLREAEDRLHQGGNTTALATPGAASVAVVGSGGTIPAALTLTYRITALTRQGLHYAQTTTGYKGHVAAPVDTAGDALPLYINGESIQGTASAAIGPTTLNDAHVLTWTDVPDAVGYNVYVDIGGGGYKYIATVELNTYTLAVDPASLPLVDPGNGNAPPAGDASADPDAWDGLLQQLRAAGAPISSLDGAALTASTGTKSIAEWDTIFESVYRSTQTGPQEIYFGPEIATSIPSKIGGDSATVIQLDQNGQGQEFVGGITVRRILNIHTGETVQLKTHPTLPAGLVLGLRFDPPYSHARQAGESIDVVRGQDYEVEPFAKTKHSQEFGVSSIETLRVRSSLGCFIQKNVGV